MSAQGYVGVTKHFDKRMKQHNWNHPNPHFANAIDKHGWDNLVKEVVLIADEDYCLDIERKLRTQENIGWNIVAGGGKPPVMSGPRPELCGRTPWNKGKTMPEATRKKISEAVKAQMADPEHRKKLSEIAKGRPSPMKGRKHSAETVANMKKEHECPHCGVVGKGNVMLRHHFKNCKENTNASS